MTVRSRFAPSPTGFLHIGGVRTALFSWLFARKHQGQFILRIEDTDAERSTKESVQAILAGMSWLGLNCDEGPFYQMQRMSRYQAVVQQLLDEGKAYRCACSKERLEKLREDLLANKQKPRYDGHCRDLDVDENTPHVIRFRNPDEGFVEFEDFVRGPIKVSNTELDDVILVRSDGVPTYNFSVVVDDMDMNITHVIRGDDHINNTPRQINIYQALGKKPPLYGHVPMILGEDGKRLSKRHGAASVMEYREQGILPEALLNYLVRLGWSHGDQEIFSLDEMIALFDVEHIHKAAAAINPDKLLWLNQHYLKANSAEDIAKELAWHFQQIGIDVTRGPGLIDIVNVQRERVKTLKEMAERSTYFYCDIESYDEKAVNKNLKLETKEILQAIHDRLQTLPSWSEALLHQVIKDTAAERELKLGKVAQPIRIAITGGTVSPPLGVTLQLLGRERVLNRLQIAMKFCQ